MDGWLGRYWGYAFRRCDGGWLPPGWTNEAPTARSDVSHAERKPEAAASSASQFGASTLSWSWLSSAASPSRLARVLHQSPAAVLAEGWQRLDHPPRPGLLRQVVAVRTFLLAPFPPQPLPSFTLGDRRFTAFSSGRHWTAAWTSWWSPAPDAGSAPHCAASAARARP
jgi:hypothetical protein